MLQKISEFAEKYNMLPQGGTILAGVSGGADSMCLLAALLELADTRGLTVIAAHFNHRLRGAESDRDESFVRDFCERRGVRILTGAGNVAASEDAARRARYAFFDEAAQESGASRIATAHTADDNAETVVMNLARGAGTAGLSGIPPVRGTIVRPMLTVTRDDVLKFLSERGVSYVEDSTNSSDIYTRNRVRSSVIPLLREINPKFFDAVTAASGLLRADEEYLLGLADEFVRGNVRGGAVSADKLTELPPVVAARVIRLLGGRGVTHRHVEDVLALCQKGGGSRRLSLPGMTVYMEQDRVVFGGEDGPEFAAFWPVVGETVIIREAKLKITCQFTIFDDRINKSLTIFHFKPDCVCDKIIVRPRIAGDFIKIAGRNGTKSLKKLFIEGRVPARERGLVPVIADGRGVLAVYGFGAGERAAAERGSVALEIKFEGAADNE